MAQYAQANNVRGTRIMADASVRPGNADGAGTTTSAPPPRSPRLRVSIGTMLFAAVVAAILAAVVTATVFTARSKEDALRQEIDVLTVKLATAAQALENCQASRESVSTAVTELSAARDDMDRALAAFDQGVSMDETELALIAANARYAGALDALVAIPGCGSG